MALQMPHTVRGITAPVSYWKVAQTNLDHVSKTGQLVFNCYYDGTARDADPLVNVIDQKSYAISKELYAEYFAEEMDLRAQSYLMAKAVLEGNAPAEGEEDTRKSFFDGAVDV